MPVNQKLMRANMQIILPEMMMLFLLMIFFTRKPVKKALQGLGNQLHLEDYWRRIVSEILVLNRDEEQGVKEISDEGDGGQDNLCLEASEAEEEAESLPPRPHLLEVGGPLESLHQETFSGLRQFLTAAQLEGLRCPGEDPPTRLPFGPRRPSSASSQAERSVREVLETTTLSQLLVAAENVRRKSVMQNPTLGVPQPPRRSVVRGLLGIPGEMGRRLSSIGWGGGPPLVEEGRRLEVPGEKQTIDIVYSTVH